MGRCPAAEAADAHLAPLVFACSAACDFELVRVLVARHQQESEEADDADEDADDEDNADTDTDARALIRQLFVALHAALAVDCV